MAAVTIHSESGVQENKICHCFHFFPFYWPWSDGMPWSSLSECWVLSQLFSLSSFTFINRLFSSSLLSATRGVSSAYMRLTKLVPFNNGNFTLSLFWRSSKSRYWQGWFLLEENIPCLSLTFCVSGYPLVPWLVEDSFQTLSPSLCGFLLWVCLKSPSPFFHKDTSHWI